MGRWVHGLPERDIAGSPEWRLSDHGRRSVIVLGRRLGAAKASEEHMCTHHGMHASDHRRMGRKEERENRKENIICEEKIKIK
jgi:hypothetical protein